MTAENAPAPASAPTSTRPVWARYGGLGILLGGVLLLAATVVEALFSGEASDSLTPLFSALFLVAVVVQSAAMLPFALGATGSDGATGTRSLGRWALLVFGAVYLHNQLAYYVGAYGGTAGADGFDTQWLMLAGAVVQLIALVVASVSIVRAGVATGAAKWAFPAITVVAAVAGAIANASDSAEVVTVALVSSCVTQVIAGAVILTHRPA